jgi:hypothetical protein
MPDPQVHLIVFSKDRPLQLHGMLTSVFRHWQGAIRVDVLINAHPDYTKAYVEVYKELMASLGDRTERLTFEIEAAFDPERVFPASVLRILEQGDAPYVCFGCDDVVYTGPVDVPAIDRAFRDEPHLLGVSLRLGKNIDTDMFGRSMPQPAFAQPAPPAFEEYAWANAAGLRAQWRPAEATGDWGYPWEVLGTVYPTDYVRDTVAALVRSGQVQNPSTLEDAGWRRWAEHAGSRYLLQSFGRSRLVVPTVNVVQSVFGNGIVGPGGMDPAFLLDCWNRGLRLDVDRFRGMAPPSWRISDLYLRRAG